MAQIASRDLKAPEIAVDVTTTWNEIVPDRFEVMAARGVVLENSRHVNGGAKMRHSGGVKIPHGRLGSLST